MNKRTVLILSIVLFASLLIWGVITLIAYMGIPYHIAILAGEGKVQPLIDQCGEGGRLCLGLRALWPFLLLTISRLGPFAFYIVLSIVLYGIYVGVRVFREKTMDLQWKPRPVSLLLLFTFSLLLLFSGLAFGSVKVGGGQIMPLREIVEPSEKVYTGIGPEGIERLKQNFQSLDDAGCLRRHRQFGDSPTFLISPHCIYASFVSKVLSQLLFILVFLLELLVVGRFALTALLKHTPPKSRALELVFSLSLGTGLWVAVLWTIAVAGVFVSTAGWLLVLLIPAILYRHTLYWLRELWHPLGDAHYCKWYHPQVLLTWLLLSYLAFNFLTVIRPFPIGWDDLGSYINRPRLMVSYGEFIHSMAPFQWEYLTSLGFLLFGYESVFGATAAMMINWTAGLIAVLTVLTFGAAFLGPGRGVLAALLYYMLPVVGHFSFADMKIDNAVFAMGGLSMLAVFVYLFPLANVEGEEEHRSLRWMVLAGLLGGFAFSMKPTAIMVLLASAAVLAGAMLHWSAFLATVSGAIVLLVLQGPLNLGKVAERIGGILSSVSAGIMLLFFALLTIVLAGITLLKARTRIKAAAMAVLTFGAFAIVPVAPWVIHNNILRGSIIPTSFEFGAPNTLTPILDITGWSADGAANAAGAPVRSLPSELVVDISDPACEPTGNIEELDRYWGFGKGLSHYLTLPWRIVMNIHSVGYYVTTIPGLLVFPLILLLPFFWVRRARWLRWMVAGTFFMVLEWIFLANGILWYGIGMFLGLTLGLEVLLMRAPDVLSRVVTGVLITLSIIMMLDMRLWQFELQRNIFEYPMGKVSYESLRERTIPHYDDIAEVVLANKAQLPDRPYLYRVGTFIPYFIPKNLEIIAAADHQLDTFNCLYRERNPALTTARLKALGFSSIIFDTNTATIEKDLEGSLHKKVEAFVNYLNNPESGVRPVLNDPGAGVAFILIP